jgi:hypothetical protein
VNPSNLTESSADPSAQVAEVVADDIAGLEKLVRSEKSGMGGIYCVLRVLREWRELVLGPPPVL